MSVPIFCNLRHITDATGIRSGGNSGYRDSHCPDFCHDRSNAIAHTFVGGVTIPQEYDVFHLGVSCLQCPGGFHQERIIAPRIAHAVKLIDFALNGSPIDNMLNGYSPCATRTTTSVPKSAKSIAVQNPNLIHRVEQINESLCGLFRHINHIWHFEVFDHKCYCNGR